MKFEEFEKTIKEIFLENTLRSFSPKIAHRREYKGHYYPGYEIGVNINTGIFLFLWEEGGGVMIGPPASSFGDAQTGWFSLDRIISFVSQQPFVWETPFQGMPRDKQIHATFRSLQEEFAPYANFIVSMVSSAEKVNEWAHDYEMYEAGQFKLAYPAYYEEYKKQRKGDKLRKK